MKLISSITLIGCLVFLPAANCTTQEKQEAATGGKIATQIACAILNAALPDQTIQDICGIVVADWPSVQPALTLNRASVRAALGPPSAAGDAGLPTSAAIGAVAGPAAVKFATIAKDGGN